MTTRIDPKDFDFDKWYAEQDKLARTHAQGIGAANANDKWSAKDYEDAIWEAYQKNKAYASEMTAKHDDAWIAAAGGTVQPARSMLKDQIDRYLVGYEGPDPDTFEAVDLQDAS